MQQSIHQYTASTSFSPSLKTVYELTKPGITYFVMLSMSIGFLMGSGTVGTDAVDSAASVAMDGGASIGTVSVGLSAGAGLRLFLTALFGTWLVASGTAAMNMVMEGGLDGLMRRTATRPIPSGRMTRQTAFSIALILLILGFLVLLIGVNVLTGIISMATSLVYLAAYTPMKRISPANVFVGAVPGALPVVGGWAAATGTIMDYGMWMLFWIMFLWQVPHVMAIAWLNRADYHHAGFQMLPRRDPKGLQTSVWVLGALAALLPNVWKLWVLGLGGWIWLAGALLLTAGYLLFGILFAIRRDRDSARRLMFFSFVYLPGVWLVLFTDRILAWTSVG